MKEIIKIVLLSPLIFILGCNSELKVLVYDNKTKLPVPEAYVYVNEFVMFSPFNTSNLYLTDENGEVTISQDIHNGGMYVYAGKENYKLNLYLGDYANKDSIKIPLYKSSINRYFRLRQIYMRNNLLKEYRYDSLLRDFIQYCSNEKIEIYKSYKLPINVNQLKGYE